MLTRFPERARDVLSNNNKYVNEYFFQSKGNKTVIREEKFEPFIRFFKTEDEINSILAGHVTTVLLSLKDFAHREVLQFLIKFDVSQHILRHLSDYSIGVELVEPLILSFQLDFVTETVSVLKTVSNKDSKNEYTEEEMSKGKEQFPMTRGLIVDDLKIFERNSPYKSDFNITDDPFEANRKDSSRRKSIRSSNNNSVVTEEISHFLQELFSFRARFVLQMLLAAKNSEDSFVSKNISMSFVNFFAKSNEIDDFSDLVKESFYKDEFVKTLCSEIKDSLSHIHKFSCYCEILVLLFKSYSSIFNQGEEENDSVSAARADLFLEFVELIPFLNSQIEAVG
jgi:hypothetical protein